MGSRLSREKKWNFLYFFGGSLRIEVMLRMRKCEVRTKIAIIRNGRWDTSCGEFDRKPFLIRFSNRKYPFSFLYIIEYFSPWYKRKFLWNTVWLWCQVQYSSIMGKRKVWTFCILNVAINKIEKGALLMIKGFSFLHIFSL